MWPHPPLDFGLPASRTVRQYISVLLSRQSMVPCYRSHEKCMQESSEPYTHNTSVNLDNGPLRCVITVPSFYRCPSEAPRGWTVFLKVPRAGNTRFPQPRDTRLWLLCYFSHLLGSHAGPLPPSFLSSLPLRLP